MFHSQSSTSWYLQKLWFKSCVYIFSLISHSNSKVVYIFYVRNVPGGQLYIFGLQVIWNYLLCAWWTTIYLWLTSHLKLSFMCLVDIYLWLTSHLNLIESQNVEHIIWSWLLYHPMYTICSLEIKKVNIFFFQYFR